MQFLERQHLTIPEAVYQVWATGDGGHLIRTGASDFFIESGHRGNTVAKIAQAVGRGGDGVYPVPREDASFLLSGRRALEVLAQTCGFDFRETVGASSRVGLMTGPFVMTRIAGVSVSVLPRTLNGIPVFQLWLDYSYGLALWEQLLAIVRELEGGVVGLSCFLPTLGGHPAA